MRLIIFLLLANASCSLICETLVIEGELTHMSSAPVPEHFSPYRDALFVCRYRVNRVLSGTCKETQVLVAHWAYSNLQRTALLDRTVGTTHTLTLSLLQDHADLKQTYCRDDLDDLDQPIWYDSTGIASTEAVTVASRGARTAAETVYGCSLEERMPYYLALWRQLRLVGIGDSHMMNGFMPERCYGETNRHTPVAFNMAMASSQPAANQILVETYLSRLPRLEWVVYGVQPRNFSGLDLLGPSKPNLASTAGFRYDVQHLDRLFADSSGNPMTLDELARFNPEPFTARWSSAPYGYAEKGTRGRSTYAGAPVQQELSITAMTRFRTIARFLGRRGVRLMYVMTPQANDQAASPDLHALTEAMQQLAESEPNVVFLDLLTNVSQHFPPSHFADEDHCSRSGAECMTDLIEAKRIEAERAMNAGPSRVSIEAVTACGESDRVRVRFSAAIMGELPAHGFTISDGAISACRLVERHLVELTTTPHKPGERRTLRISGILDAWGIRIPDQNFTYVYQPTLIISDLLPADLLHETVSEGRPQYSDATKYVQPVVPQGWLQSVAIRTRRNNATESVHFTSAVPVEVGLVCEVKLKDRNADSFRWLSEWCFAGRYGNSGAHLFTRVYPPGPVVIPAWASLDSGYRLLVRPARQ